MEDKTMKMINQAKEKIVSLLSKDSPKETIDAITEITQTLDNASTEHQTLIDENGSLKNTLIEYVRKGNVDTKTVPDDPGEPKAMPTFEDFVNQKLKEKK